ncbi:hypothetical protein ORV05_30360 [Amycolatopsis cynarae]|uniref:Uncharacterized protein n=1 Tax=Amycolatopsis cynarae TaxID=2995223 RepID=A0ABY7AYT8_9PSEU|nr:hypothetical protein [Amycolatopsis sp. HUAS 11-8]WAL65175.1 hypothetical protein ORV05_30360 [Amycolatopsis sp. HUAS 11-8]
MAEQRPEHEQEPAPGGAVERAQPPLDPEQLRQFQQFQQFQDFLRFQEAQGSGQLVPTQQPGSPVPPPPPGGQLQVATPPSPPAPRIRAPRWAKRLAGKVLSAILFLIVLAIGGKLAYDHFFPPPKEDLPAAITGGGTYHANKILSAEPYEAVRKVYQQIAQNRPDLACGYFDIPVQQKFALDLGAADCRDAVGRLKAQVTDVNAYAESLPSYLSGNPGATTLTIDSCDFPITGGPALGVFTVSKVDKGQWLITDHRPGPARCPSPTVSGTPSR